MESNRAWAAVIAGVSIACNILFHHADAAEQSGACSSSQPKYTVCNLAWKEGCRQVAAVGRPACKRLGPIPSQASGAVSTLKANERTIDLSGVFGYKRLGVELPPVNLGQFIMAPDSIAKATEAALREALTAVRPLRDLFANATDPHSMILAELDKDPLSTEAQGKARDLIRSCATGDTTPRQMHACSGFRVTPIVYLQCMGNGPCMPVSWDAKGVGAAGPSWSRDAADDIPYAKADAQGALAAYARPWVASKQDVDACATEAARNTKVSADPSGAADEKTKRFSLCMAKRMGGDSARRTLQCIAGKGASSLDFAACLAGHSVPRGVVDQAQCLANKDESIQCLKGFALPPAQQKACEKAAGIDEKALQACLAKLPRSVAPAAECARAYHGDVSATSHCIAGAYAIQVKGPGMRSALDCGVKVMQGAAKPTTQAQKGMLDCMAERQPDLARLAKATGAAGKAAECLQDAGKDLGAKAQCLRAAGVKFPKEVELAQCVAKAKGAAEAAACAGMSGASKVAAAQRCLAESGSDNTRKALCIGSQVDMPADQARVLACAATSSGAADGLACVIGPALPPAVALAASCAVQAQGSPAGIAMCVAGPSMNAELRIAAECATSTGGEPMSFTACAGGRLTMKELQQCIGGGFKAENGCFGDGNEIVKFYKAQEEQLRGALRTLKLEGAYDNMLKDLKDGKLGENNDIRRIANLMNDVATRPPAETAQRALDEATRVGVTVGEGTAKLNEELGKVAAKLKEEVDKNMPKLPPVTARTDLPGGGDAQVSLSPSGGSAQIGNNKVEADVSRGSGQVQVGGVTIIKGRLW